MVAAQRRHARACGFDQRLDNGAGNVVAVQRGVQRRLVAARARVEPVALADAVVERRVRVDVLLERSVVAEKRGAPIGLAAIGRQHGAILRIRHGDLLAGAELDFRELRVGGRERLVRFVRRAGQSRRERHQPLALLVQHVLLLAVHLFNGEAVHRQRGGRVHPGPHGREGNAEQLRTEPRRRFLPSRHQRLHLLAAGIHHVVALVLVVFQAREEIDLVSELAEVVVQLVRRQELRRAAPQGALQCGVFTNPAFQLCVCGFPGRPVRVNVVKTPLVVVRDVGAVSWSGFCRYRHLTMIWGPTGVRPPGQLKKLSLSSPGWPEAGPTPL